ncbi:MAG: cyclodeaminase/cyclohydrolase family protein [Candidatus Thermoplasmatota archaeon]|nr:cyclodeaminase/cyclohydrolase family protein [Candidatus Thermoplasmatota archaeon]
MNKGYEDVLSSISSSNPTPGGGSVSALILSHAHSLATMVARLTTGRDKWSDGQVIAEKIISKSEESIETSLRLAKEDALAFDSVMNSYRLPKDTDELKETRKEAIFDSTINAASVPLEIMHEASNLLNDIINLAKFGNLNALTDLLGSAELAYSSSKIASLNVRINLDSINSGDQKDDLKAQVLELTLLTKERYEIINEIIMERLQWK